MEEESNGNSEKWPRQLGKMLIAIVASIPAAASHSQASSPRRFMEGLGAGRGEEGRGGARRGIRGEYQQICKDFYCHQKLSMREARR